MTLWWIVGLGGVSFFALLFFSRNEFFQKPDRLNVRDTPLYKAIGRASRRDKRTEYEIDELPQEDVVYSGIRRLSQTLTCRLSLNEPLAMMVCLFGIAVAFAIYVVAISTTMG